MWMLFQTGIRYSTILCLKRMFPIIKDKAILFWDKNKCLAEGLNFVIIVFGISGSNTVNQCPRYHMLTYSKEEMQMNVILKENLNK